MQEAQEIELLPCPFCGSNDLYYDTVSSVTYKELEKIKTYLFVINCEDCSVSGGEYYHPEDAAEAWNKRTYETFFEEIKHHADNGHKTLSVKWLLNEINKLNVKDDTNDKCNNEHTDGATT
jgi:Lar family restriction alleviation protein